jgi:Mrp family chromosome partitioning ATPase
MNSDSRHTITKPVHEIDNILPTEPPAEGELVHAPGTDRQIVIAPALRGIDTSVVAFPYYNSFNYSILSGNRTKVQLTVGITSPNRGEGKTLTASNLAMSLTLGYRKKTVIVDLNFQSPRIHDIFGAAPGPGLLEALDGAPLRISSTRVEHLHVLTAGNPDRRRNGSRRHPVGIERTAEFGEIIGALRREFSFIIVDMPSINNREFPILFVDPLDGVLVVTEPGKTRRRDISRMFRHLHRNQVLGVIFNRVKEENE